MTSVASTARRKDRPLHKLLCHKLVPFLKTRPADADGHATKYKLAFLFPKNTASPELIWVKNKLIMDRTKGL